jgi:LuxR family maltose regulon positive regulatory protein
LSVPGLTLIRSKLLVPSPAGLLHRPRVSQAIEYGLERKLTLISAPAGYGKTSALIGFARRSPVPVCWYTADERDRDLGVFIEYLVGAVQERFPGFGQRTQAALDSLSGDLLQGSAGVVGELVNEMLEIDSPLVLVVDNYEALDGAFGIRTFVRHLLDVLPFNCHLMLGSRVLPGVPVARLVAKSQLVGLTTQELRFTPQEIQDLLQLSQVGIPEAQAKAIAAKSEGWITGVLLLADLLREGAGADVLGVEKVTADTYDYLAREVVSRQPPDIQQFLHASAVLREVSPRLSREILDVRDPRALMTEVERRNLFVTRLGRGGGVTYRYHNLFRDFLHRRLRQSDPTRYAELHMRAARRFERDNDIEEAVYHYLAADSHPNATVLMERVALEWFTRGRVETLLGWADTLSEDARPEAPRLLLYQSKVLTDRYGYEQARQALEYAEAGFACREDASQLAGVYNQRALLELFEGRYEDAVVEAQKSLTILDRHETAGRAQAQQLIGRAYVGLGRFNEGIVQLQEALGLYRESGSLYDVVNLLQDLGTALVDVGRFDEAVNCMSEALTIGRRLGSLTQLAGVLNNLGWLQYARGEYQESLTLYEEGLAAAQRGGALRFQAYIAVGMADLYRDVGAYERAGRLYNDGWQIAQDSEPGLAVYLLTAHSCAHRWQGDYTRAMTLLEHARQLAEEKGLEFETRGLLPVDKGITLVESGDGEAGRCLLSDAACFLEQRQARRELARARFLLAKAYLLAGERAKAVLELRRAMDLVDEIGTYQFAAVEGQHAEDLLRLGIAEGIASCRLIPDRVERLRAFREELAQTDTPGETEEGVVSRLDVYALGEGRVVCDGRPVPPSEWQGAMAKELFFYILLHGPLERDAIGLVFWPDLSTRRMRDSFHTTLYRMRRAVGAGGVVVEDGRYRVGDVDCWFDVEQFEESVERARLLPPRDWQTEDLWRRAVALYGGDFLPEVDRVWCVPKREALREMYIEALVGVGQCQEVRQVFDEAIGWYRRALEVDGLREDVHRRIMHCYDRAGRRSEALAQYRRCQEILMRDLGFEPSLETRQLYERILGRIAD